MFTRIYIIIPYRTAKFKSANIFVSAALDETAKFKDTNISGYNNGSLNRFGTC